MTPALRQLLLIPGGTPGFVLHPSVAAAWLFHQRATDYTSDVLARLASTTAAVPTSWPIDFAAVLLDGERVGLRSAGEVTHFHTRFDLFPTLIDTASPLDYWTDLLAIARTSNLSVADAAYIELARRLRLPLATTDPTLAAAATAAGVPMLTP